MSGPGFYPLRALAELYCGNAPCDHHRHAHKLIAGVLVCTGVDALGRPCKCPGGFRPRTPKEPTR